MFEAFHTAAAGIPSRRRLAISTTAAVGVYAVVAAFLLIVGRRMVAPPPEPLLEVAFEKLKPKPLPPPPPPKIIPRRPRIIVPPAAAALPPPARPLEAPKEIPKEAPPEAAPGSAPAPSEIDTTRADGVAGGVRGGTGSAPVAALVVDPGQPVNLPEEATPPVPSVDNAAPTYPEAARVAGQEGMVILKIVVTAEGRVTNIKVLKGEGPFVAAAVAAVQKHTYQPAVLNGRPIAVYRILKIPFRLSIGG